MGKLLEELKRRKVFRVAAVYAVVAWVLIQVADTVLPALQMPNWTVSFVTVLFILGFPIALILSWAYEATPEGIKADLGAQASVPAPTQQSQSLIYAMFALLLVAVGFQIADRFVLDDGPALQVEVASSSAQLPSTQLSVNLSEDISYRAFNGGERGLTLSPDGLQLVFTGLISENETRAPALIHRSLNQRALSPMPGREGVRHNPFFSPDSRSVGYFNEDGQMQRVTLDGRPPVTITEASTEFSNGLWIDATIYFTALPSSSLYSVSVEGGLTQEIPFDREDVSTFIRSLFYVQDTGEILLGRGPGPVQEIILLNKETGETHQILENATLVGYLDEGYLFYLQESNLMAARFDAATRRLGFAVPALEGFAWDASRRTPQISLSKSGTLSYVVEPVTTIPTTLNTVQADGTRSFLAELPEGSVIAKLSPDGKYAAISTMLTPYRVYLWDMVLQVPTGLEVENAKSAVWHPDGEHLVLFVRGDAVSLNIHDGSQEILFSGPSGIDTPSLGSDEETLVFVTSNTDGTRGIYAQLPGEDTPRAIIVTAQDAFNPVLSPDGQWLAYDSGTGWESSVYVAKFPSGTERRRVSTGVNSRYPLWRSDGQALFFGTATTPGGAIEMQTVEAESAELEPFGPPQTLFTITDSTNTNPEEIGGFSNWGASYDVSDDGSEFLMIYHAANRNADEIVIVQNWITELERLLPSDRF